RSDTLLGHLPQKIYIYSGKLDYMRSIGKWGKLETGWKSSYVKTDNNAFYEEIVDAKSILDSARTNHFIYKESIHAGYATISKSFNSKWSTKLGLRVEHTEASGTSKGYEFQTAEDKFVYKTRT